MDAAQWARDVGNNGGYNNQVQDKRVKPQDEQALNCPRCNSTNTKFCYYNNYSLTQPRYFCKACKRYWTKGGSLRSVPVGGGSRKNKRSVSSTPSMAKPIDLSQFSSQNFTTHEGQDLNLGTQEEYHHGFSHFLKLPKIENNNANFLSTLTYKNTSMIPTNENIMFNGTRFNLQDFKPTMGFAFQGTDGFMNQQHSSRENGQSMDQGNSTAYWNETMGGGSSTLYN